MPSLLPPNRTFLESNIEDSIEQRLSAIPVHIRYNKNPNLIDANLLGLLAQEFSVDYWDNEWSEIKKREVISQSINLHKFKGSVWSVRQAIEIIDPLSSIIEPSSELIFTFIMHTGLRFGNGLEPNTVKINSFLGNAKSIKELQSAVINNKPLHVSATVVVSDELQASLTISSGAFFRTSILIRGSLA